MSTFHVNLWASVCLSILLSVCRSVNWYVCHRNVGNIWTEFYGQPSPTLWTTFYHTIQTTGLTFQQTAKQWPWPSWTNIERLGCFNCSVDLAGPTLNRLVVIVLFLFVHIEHSRDPVSHVHQHDLQGVSIHSLLIGQSRVIRVIYFSLVFWTILYKT